MKVSVSTLFVLAAVGRRAGAAAALDGKVEPPDLVPGGRDLQDELPPVADILFFEPTVPFLEMLETATGLGLTYAVANEAQFNLMTTADFKKYKAIVFADPSCSALGVVAGAMASRATWSSAVDGNVIVIGTDEVYHWTQGGQELATNALKFAADAPGKTGLYFSLSCYYHGTILTDIPILDKIGVFKVDQAPGCFNDAHIVAIHPVTASLTDEEISGWSCSVHEVLPTYPAAFIPLAIAEGVGSMTFADGTVGTPYIVIRGEAVTPVNCGNNIVESPEECDDGNIVNGDGCSQFCKVEVCGDGLVGLGEQCDDGNTAPGDGCSPTCLIESSCRDPAAFCCGQPDATPCDTDDKCVKDPVCFGNVCQGAPKLCTPPTQCKTSSCDPDVGCVFEHKPNGEACDDGKDTTVDDVCVDGFCVGTCTGPCCGKADGTACNTGNKCRKDSKCVDEVCKGRLKICTAPTTCKEVVGECNSSTGFCTFRNKPDGSACRGGTCSGGFCVRE